VSAVAEVTGLVPEEEVIGNVPASASAAIAPAEVEVDPRRTDYRLLRAETAEPFDDILDRLPCNGETQMMTLARSTLLSVALRPMLFKYSIRL